jgi:hypothetical protein
MPDTDPPLGPIEGLITLETLRTALLDGIDRRGGADGVFVASRRDRRIKGCVVAVGIDEDDDVVLQVDASSPVRLDVLWNDVETICDAERSDTPVFLKHIRLGLVIGALVGAGPDQEGDLVLSFDFVEDVLAAHADELAEQVSA